MVIAMMTQSSALCANWSINRLHHTSAFPPYGVLAIRPFEFIFWRWLSTSKSIKLFSVFKDFLFTFYFHSLKKSIDCLENNFQDDNAIVYAWINLSVGKKKKGTRGSEKGSKSYADAFVRENLNLLNMSVNSKTEMKTLSFFFPFYFFFSCILKLTIQGLKYFWALGRRKKRRMR